MFREGQQIGLYTLIRKLGQGGFGEVWLAKNSKNSPSEKVAIKLPRKEQIDLQAVKDEIFNWILSGKHKNILPIIECETFGNQIAIVSEFAPDGSLQDLLKKHGSFSVSDAVEITVGILDGLAHLHKRKIIHRDLKPDNVLFQGRIPRLTDFGISRALTVDSQSQTISGTLAYMALECFDGKRNELTDIWAVGAILYQLLTGKLPFPQKTQEERVFAMVMKEPAPLPDSLPPSLQTIVKKSLAKEPANRFQTANEMIEELHQFLQKVVKPIPPPVKPIEPTPIIVEPILDKPDSIVTDIKVPSENYETESTFRPVSSQAKSKKNLLYFGFPAVALILFAIIGGSYWLTSNNSSQPIRIGSKDFTESVILAEILAQMLEKRGIAVERRLELGGNLAHDALVSNQLDTYPEYTGTAYTAILKRPPVTDTNRVYDETRREYAEKLDLLVSPPLGFSNDFAILIRGDAARKNNLKTISDAVPLSRNWQAGFGQDFMSRAGGYAGFSKAYNFDFAKQPREMDLALTYRALKSGQVDMIAGNSTDGLVSALDLFQLEDDRKYFPPYQAVFIVRNNKAKILNEVFQKLNNAISTEEMRRMNYEVDGKNRMPKDVAANWIKNENF